jgi:protoheme IX farnesyltransferase
VLGALALVPVSLLPALNGTSGNTYAFGAVLLGAYFCAAAVRFALARDNAAARRLLRASLLYLPALLALMFLDGVR